MSAPVEQAAPGASAIAPASTPIQLTEATFKQLVEAAIGKAKTDAEAEPGKIETAVKAIPGKLKAVDWVKVVIGIVAATALALHFPKVLAAVF
jgi:hypothetical protein